MSQIFVCVIKREKHTIPPAFLEQIAQLASRSDMYVFCPPKYIEEFMRTPKYGNLLVFDLADNDEYDDCEEYIVTGDELRKLSFLQHPQEVLAVFPQTQTELPTTFEKEIILVK